MGTNWRSPTALHHELAQLSPEFREGDIESPHTGGSSPSISSSSARSKAFPRMIPIHFQKRIKVVRLKTLTIVLTLAVDQLGNSLAALGRDQ
jgi:hypothetical protein